MFVIHLDFSDIVTLTIVILMALLIFFAVCSEWMYSKSKRRDHDEGS